MPMLTWCATLGPLKIFGLDLKKIYEMVKRLYELIKDLEAICSIMLNIVGLGAAALVAKAVRIKTLCSRCHTQSEANQDTSYQLKKPGELASEVWKAVKKIFGSDDEDEDSSSSDEDDGGDSSGSNWSPSSPDWAVGGSGVNNGSPGKASCSRCTRRAHSVALRPPQPSTRPS